MRSSWPLASLLLLPFTAWSSTVLGNPNGSITSIDGDDIYIDRLIGKWCGGGRTTLDIEKTLDEGQDTDITLAEVEYCLVVLEVEWTPAGPLEEVVVTGFDTLDITTSADEFVIELDASAETATLNVP